MLEHRHSLSMAAMVLAAAALAAACTGHDSTPLGVEGARQPETLVPLARLQCAASVVRGTVRCEPVRASTGEASAAEVYAGATQVKLVSSNLVITDTTFAFDTRLVNLLGQKIGTTDGINLHADGTRAFFENVPTVTAKLNNALPASISVKNPDGVTGFRTNQPGYTSWPSRPYFQYDAVLQPGDTAAAKRWILQTSNVASFSFTVLVAARVQFPSGWVEITPAYAVLEPGATLRVMGRRKNYLGAYVGTGALTWSSSATGTAVVTALSDTTARIDAISDGVATILASGPNVEYTYQPNRVGTAAVTVQTP